jgi:hypothetical protein
MLSLINLQVLRVMPTYTAYKETCTIYKQNSTPIQKVKTIRVKHQNKGLGNLPEEFIIPQEDR